MTSMAAKRKPNVLVTDAREAPYRQQPQRPAVPTRTSTRLITVDNVLQYASDVPSAQKRVTSGGAPPAHPTRTPSGRHPLDPKLAGRVVPAPQHIPPRTSKLSEKLVLLPETAGSPPGDDANDDDDRAPPTDERVAERRGKQSGIFQDKTYAERLPKSSRADQLSRVTAYCTAQAYRMKLTAEFVRDQHGAKTKLYDDCLYTVYHLPLLPGSDGFRVRSSPVLKSPGGKAVLDEEIERNERHEYQEGYFGEEQYHVREDRWDSPNQTPPDNPAATHDSPRSSSPPPSATDSMAFAEMFVFSYGVVVFWNFTELQEKSVLADLTFSSATLATRPQSEEDFETEEFHFEYNSDVPRPRVFNDMITLKSGDHMIKLAMSHAIAQSTKLSFFEERMAATMLEAQFVPRRLALDGRLGMKREEVVKMLGKLFRSRVDVNLSSNMLDVPDFFWTSEPILNPLYSAVREYLEIKPRIQVLNERCRVFLDLAEILSDSVADQKMSRITWIIIVLIIISILVTCTEVLLRFSILARQGAVNGARDNMGAGHLLQHYSGIGSPP